ncbi:MAG: hypothetical protein RLZZ111_618 [Planctomycetota bacterium]
MRQDLREPSGRRRRRRRRPLGYGIAVLLGLAMAAAPASAVVIDTPTGTGNTAAPGDDPGWANVGLRGIGTGVYLGDGWVITAAHVGGGSIVLSGTSYAMLAGSGTTLTNNGEPGKSAATDLYMYRLASPPPGLPAVTIATTAAVPGDAVTMIGVGRDRGAFTEWSVNTGTTPWAWTEVSSGGDAAGYQTLSGRSMRWGTNSVLASGLWLDDGFADVNMLSTDFTFSGTPSTEAQAAYGDSGGAVFRKTGSAWELSGLMLAVGGFSGQPDPGTHALYGNVTYAADLSFYRSQIVSIVPEPSAIALLATAAAAAAGTCSRSARSRRARGHG